MIAPFARPWRVPFARALPLLVSRAALRRRIREAGIHRTLARRHWLWLGPGEYAGPMSWRQLLDYPLDSARG